MASAKMKMRRLLRFSQVATAYITREEKDTKLKWAINRVLSQFSDLQTKMELRLNKIAVENAREYETGEKKGALMRDDQGNLMYSRESFNEMERLKAAYLDNESGEDGIEFEPYFARRVPSGIDYIVLKVFEDIAISPEMVKELIDQREALLVDGDEEEETKTVPVEGKANGLSSEQPA